jgi:imidazolonepropionase-like amidohydrolase
MTMTGTNTIEPIAELDRLADESRRRAVWLRVGRLIDGVSREVMRDVDLVFDAQSIRAVGSPAADRREPDLVLSDYTVLPCLIEAHAHLFLDGAPVAFEQRAAYLKKPADWMLARARARWPKILACGVGAVRDAGDKHGVGLALAKEARARQGELADTPFIDSPGPGIHHRGRYGAFMGQPIEDYATPADCVAARVRDGAARIKLIATGIINFQAGKVTTPPQMSGEEIAQLVAAARQHARPTFAHASGADGIENCITGAVDTIEHGFFITPEQLAKMRDRHIAWVPTFAPVQLQIDRAADLGWSEEIVGHLKRIIESHQEMLRRSHELGVTVLAGSDAGSCGVPHGIGLLREMCQMERVGMPALAVLRAATGASAATLAFPEKIGRIAPGCRSRLIFTRHDPSQSVANLLKEKTTIFDGQTVHCDESLDTEGL